MPVFYFMTLTKEIMERSNQLQAECHKYIDEIIGLDNPTVSHQDGTNVWVFCKIAELESKIYELSNLK